MTTNRKRLEIELGISRQIPIMVRDSEDERKYGWYDRLDSTSQSAKTDREGLIEQFIQRIQATENKDSFQPSKRKQKASKDIIRELVEQEMALQEDETFAEVARRWLHGRWVTASLEPTEDSKTIPVEPVDFTDAEVDYIIKSLDGEIEEDVKPEIKDFGVVSVDMTKTYGRGKGIKDMSHIDLSLTNVTPTADDLVARIKAILAKPKAEQPKNITILFHGIPGTGKTELAKYIANAVEKEVMKKTFGEIQSKYIGEGEKNLHQAFLDAMTEDSVLLIDELDSIGSNRENAEKSWEKTMVNQLLTELDDFNGIFIGTTNHLKSFDPAILRRLHLKVEFKPLEGEQVDRAFKHFFPKLRTPKAVQNIKLLTPGDFHAVKNKALYEPKVPTPTRIIELLQEEVDTKIKASPELSGIANKIDPLGRGLY